MSGYVDGAHICPGLILLFGKKSQTLCKQHSGFDVDACYNCMNKSDCKECAQSNKKKTVQRKEVE